MANFEPLNQVGDYIVANLQQLGWIIASIVAVLLGIVLITSGSNPQRVAFVKQAVLYLVIGSLFLVGVTWIVGTLQSISAPLSGQPTPTPTRESGNGTK